jgi:hypothetical protein
MRLGAHFFEQHSVLLTCPLILANLLEIMKLLAKAVFLIVHVVLGATGADYVMSLMSLPVRALSTVSSNFEPRSTPISRARFLAQRPTLRESR